MTNSDEYYLLPPTHGGQTLITGGESVSLSIREPEPPHNIVFTRDGQNIAELSWEDGIMRFEGNADEAAQLFFDLVIRQYVGAPTPKRGNGREPMISNTGR